MKIPSEERNTAPTTQNNSITRMKRKETKIVCKQFEVLFEDDDHVELNTCKQKLDSQNHSRYSLLSESNYSEPNILDITDDEYQNDLSSVLSSQSRNGLTEMDSASICSDDSKTSDSTLNGEYTIKSENEDSSENSSTEDSITWEEYIREQSNGQKILFCDEEYFTKDSYNLKSCLKNKSGDKEGRIKDEYKRSKKVLSWCSSLSDESDLTEENGDDATLRTGLWYSENDDKSKYDIKKTLQSQTFRPDELLIKDNSEVLSQQIFNKKHLDRSALTESCCTSKDENGICSLSNESDLTEKNNDDITMRAGLLSNSRNDDKNKYDLTNTLRQIQTDKLKEPLLKDDSEALSEQTLDENLNHLDRSAFTASCATKKDENGTGNTKPSLVKYQTIYKNKVVTTSLTTEDRTSDSANKNKNDIKETPVSAFTSKEDKEQSEKQHKHDNATDKTANCITSKEENAICSAKPSLVKYQTIFKNRVITTSLTTEDRDDGSTNANKNDDKVSEESSVSAFTSKEDQEQIKQPQIHDHLTDKTISNKNIYELELQKTKSNLKDTKISSMNPSKKKSIRSDDPSKTKSNLIDPQQEKLHPNSLQKKPSFTKDSYKDELQKYTKNLDKVISDNAKTQNFNSKSKLYPSTVRNEVYEINTIVHVTDGKDTTRLIRYKGKDKVDDSVDDVTTEGGGSELKLREELKANMDLLQSFIEEFNDVCKK